MDAKTYVENAIVTESQEFDAIRSRMTNENIRLIHAAAGMSSEVAELFQLSDKFCLPLKEGEMPRRTNLLEECGDILWYIAIACHTLGCTDLVTGTFDYDIKAIKFDDDLSMEVYGTAAKLSELTGMFQDFAVKKFVFYGKAFNDEPLIDLLNKIHMNVECLLLQGGHTIEAARERNIAKLEARYGAKFDAARALKRDLEKEQQILESK